MENKMREAVAFVTGGASGIGKAIIERIVKHGGKAVIVDINAINGQKLAETLGENVTFIKADVTSEEDIQNALEHAKRKFGYINVVVNSAGIPMFCAPYDFETEKPHSLEAFKKVMDLNVLGTFNVTRLAVGVMAKNVPDENQQRGVIINLASIMARDPPGNRLAYATSKAAVRGMTIPLARCFAEKGIRVVTMSPGYTRTPLTQNFATNPSTGLSANFVEKATLTPKRMAHADEVAHLAQTIIENAYINAVNMEISAGYHYVSQ